MFYTEDERKILLEKWEHVLCDNCEICHGEKYIDGHQCKCKTKALKNATLEASNIPMRSFKVSKEHIQNINFSFGDYFNNIQNEIYDVKNLFLYNFSNELNLEIIGHIARRLINVKKADGQPITVYYAIFENIIQMGLRSNVEKDTRNQLNAIIRNPYILFIDGLGSETGFGSPTKHNIKLLNLILKERLNRCKSTIISSNLSYSQIEQFYGKDVMSLLQNYILVRGN